MLLSSAIRRAFNKLGGISLGSGSEDRSQQTRGFFSRVGNIEWYDMAQIYTKFNFKKRWAIEILKFAKIQRNKDRKDQ